MTYGAIDRRVVFRRDEWCFKLNVAAQRCEEDETRPTLREAVCGQEDNVVHDVVAGLLQPINELAEDCPALEVQQPRNVLHGHHVGARLDDKIPELRDQPPFWVFVLLII